ncbi:MAG: YegS/Rv2252/BmrU family lipid kinase [Oscillospiraceae bacterium]|nr:YegS/Rv2252/BmrU family lipid kinase [Oscillospiraceae bacterium]
MNKKLMLIINPAAGRGGYKVNFADAMQLLSGGGFRVDLYYTAGRGDASAFARERGANYDIVACIGGDGTLSEVFDGLMDLRDPPPVGYIPMGTSNDVATTLGLPKNNCVEAARRILEGTALPYDVGSFGADGYFSYIAAFGAFTDVAYSTPQDQKNALGHLAYVLQGMAKLPTITSYHTRVEYDGGVFEGDLVYGSMSNSTSVAGIVKFRENMVSLNDGLSELVLVRTPESLDVFADLAASVLSQRFDSDSLVILQTKAARFSFDRPVAWTRDGEDGGEHRELALSTCPSALRIIR